MLGDGQLTTDTFEYSDKMTWKLERFLASINVDFDAFKKMQPKELIGKTGELIAEEHGEKVYYQYLPAA
jgi:hypothetical protein